MYYWLCHRKLQDTVQQTCLNAVSWAPPIDHESLWSESKKWGYYRTLYVLLESRMETAVSQKDLSLSLDLLIN